MQAGSFPDLTAWAWRLGLKAVGHAAVGIDGRYAAFIAKYQSFALSSVEDISGSRPVGTLFLVEDGASMIVDPPACRAAKAAAPVG